MRGQFLTICFLGLLLAGLFHPNIINAQVGHQLTLVKDPTYKSNQSQVVWYQNAWWGVFRRTGS